MSRHHTPAADQPITSMELFAGLTRRQLRQVVALSTLVHKSAGAVLAHEGQLAQEVVVLISGGAIATVDETPVAELGRGSHLGTSVLDKPAPHGATVRTATPCDILVLSVADVRSLVEQHPIVRARLEGTEAPRPSRQPECTTERVMPPLGRLIDA